MSDTDMPNVDMTDEPVQPSTGDHPFWQDLNPDFLAGENYGLQGPHPEKGPRNAYDVKGAHDKLQGMEDDDLKKIPIMPVGSRLEQGATYLDLHQAHPVEFTAMGNMTAGSDNWYVPKSATPYWLWNRLIGVENPSRLDTTT
ncbi:MAG TPA: hypothetical protein VFB58_00270 [Chloroflexota bacterium]|nr:hypothetical protein [Chloroflexota bacterium]